MLHEAIWRTQLSNYDVMLTVRPHLTYDVTEWHVIRALMVLALVALSPIFIQLSQAYYPVQSLASTTPCEVTSGGQEQKYMYTLAVSSVNHAKAYEITGARITRNVVGSSYKIYLYVKIHPASTFAVSLKGAESCTLNLSKQTNNLYWDAQSLSTGRDFGTVGGDVAIDSQTGLLLVDQYVDTSAHPGQTAVINTATSSLSPSCSISTLGQERNSIYMIFVDDSTAKSYVMTGASVVEKSVSGVTSTFLYVFLSSITMNVNTTGINASCSTSLAQKTSEFEWAVRAPPSTNTIPGNYRIYGTLGGDLSMLSGGTNAFVLEQFMDPNYQF